MMQLWKTSQLIDACFPIEADSFEIDYWRDLGTFRRMLAAQTMMGTGI
jgi:hypothetical protein